ncbi:9720_t:CDS:2, partial [Funneliformis caledonium]
MDSLQVEGVKNLLSTLDTFLDNTSIISLNNDESFFSDVAIVIDAEEAINYTTNQGT